MFVHQKFVLVTEELKFAAAAEYIEEGRAAFANEKLLAILDNQKVELVEDVWNNLEKLHN